jgi:hypothetical protein
MDRAMEKRLQEIIDRHEVWQVLQRYCRGLDRIDRELVRSCYFDDAIEDHGSFVGTVDDFIDWALRVSLSFVACHHNVMNHSCELDGDDAYCETYYLYIGVAATAPHLLSMGRYIDHFQRRNGAWRIANRVAVIEKNFDLADSLTGVGVPSAYGPDLAQPATHDRSDVSYQRPLRPRRPRPLQTR